MTPLAAGDDVRSGGAGVHGAIAQLTQLRPGKVAGVDRVAVKHDEAGRRDHGQSARAAARREKKMIRPKPVRCRNPSAVKTGT